MTHRFSIRPVLLSAILALGACTSGGGVDDADVPAGTQPDQLLIIETSALSAATAGLSYGPLVLAARGGSPPLTWEIVAGTAPHPDFLTSEGSLTGVVAVPGDYRFTVRATDAAGAAASRELELAVIAPADLDAATTPSLAAGVHWIGDLTVSSGDRLDLTGATTLNVTGKLRVEPGARIASTDCAELVINALDPTQPAELLGDIENTCATPTDAGGDLVIRARGSVILGGDADDQPSVITSSGRLFIGDAEYHPRPEPTTLSYVATIEDEDIAPVCALGTVTWPEDLAAMLPATVELAAVHSDPDGGTTSIASIDFGDGTVVNHPETLVHDYDEGGTFEVVVSVVDDEGDTCEAWVTLTLPEMFDAADPDVSDDEPVPADVADSAGAPSVAASLTDAASLVGPVGTALNLSATLSDRAYEARWDIDGETIDCTPGDTSCVAAAAFDSPGHHTVVLRATGDDGSGTTKLVVYVPLKDGSVDVADPEAAPQPFPALPRSFDGPPAGTESVAAALTDGCPGCDLCEAPALSGDPIVVLGNTALTSWWQNGAVIIGFDTANIVLTDSLVFNAVPGANGVAPGDDGKVSRGFGVATYRGRIVLCGGTFNGADGGSGAPNVGGGCDETTRGGRGMPWWGVLFTAPEGAISYCGDLRVNGASGGSGGNATHTTPAVGPACKRGCDAAAFGGRGGLGGGGIAYLAPNVCYDTDYSVTFGGGVMTGGDGGTGTSSGTEPAACNTCNKNAGRGGRAISRGGNGGRSVWYFVTHPKYAPELEDIVGHLFGGGTYLGGAGGNATATAGDGGASNCNGCTGDYAWAGRGGEARGFGGHGAFGMSGRGVRGTATAVGGHGGAGVATPNPAKSGDGCPGKRGCTLYSFGGDSGRATAWAGRGSGPRVENLTSGIGGAATATGGNGGNGVGCPGCDGGRGGKAVARAGRDSQGAPFRLDGKATANGGTGGTGATCCTPPKEGGDGGKGGFARADGRKTGATAGGGGDGGDGGDGEGPGSGGLKGLGAGTLLDIPDGARGKDGEHCPVKRCMNNADCDDGDPCTEDACEEGYCLHYAIAGCCVADAQCDDGKACTTDACVDNVCQHGDVPDCCETAADCDDSDACTEDACVGHVCQNAALEGCCSSAADCEDGNACTNDSCVDYVCKHQPLTPCVPCAVDSDCDDNVVCSSDACVQGVCQHQTKPNCCTGDSDCADDDMCTEDACVEHACQHYPVNGNGCGEQTCAADGQPKVFEAPAGGGVLPWMGGEPTDLPGWMDFAMVSLFGEGDFVAVTFSLPEPLPMQPPAFYPGNVYAELSLVFFAPGLPGDPGAAHRRSDGDRRGPATAGATGHDQRLGHPAGLAQLRSGFGHHVRGFRDLWRQRRRRRRR